MQALDMIFLVLIGLLVLRGFLKGFTGELFFIASLSLALTASVLFFKPGAAFIRLHYLQMKLLPEMLSFLIIFIVIFIVGKILERIVKDIIDRLYLDALDKVLGIFIGLAEGFILIVIILFVITIQPLFDPIPLITQSLFARLLLPFVGGIRV